MRSPLLPPLPGYVVSAHLGPEDAAGESAMPEDALLSPTAAHRRLVDFRRGRIVAHDVVDQLGVTTDMIGRGTSREPLWPPGIVGSITHAAHHAIAIGAYASDCLVIGVDLETVERYFVGLEHQIAFGTELAWLEQLAEPMRPAKTIALFAAKEAIYKAFFPRVQQYFGMKGARLEPDATETGFVARLTEPIDTAYSPDRSFPVSVRQTGPIVVASLVLTH